MNRIQSKVILPYEQAINEAYEKRTVVKTANTGPALETLGFFTNKSKILVHCIKNVKTNVMPTMIAHYIGEQLSRPLTSRNIGFKQGLNSGISKIIESIVINDVNISGVKIICKGRWSKTNTGRKQYLRVITGSLNSTSFSTKLCYNSQSITTRYGNCNICVWIKYCC